MTDGLSRGTQQHVAEPVDSLIRRWLCSGRLQSPAGAFCAWRDGETGDLAYEYPEITGYALTWLAGREELQPAELESGHRAARWLVARLATGNRSARERWDGGVVYSFDLGMVAVGLMSFGRRVGEPSYSDQGEQLARELAAEVSSPRGLRAIVPGGPSTSRASQWSTDGGAHLVKCVQALLLAGLGEAASALRLQAGGLQAPEGRFQTQPDDSYTMVHPHLYAVEGLWMLGTATGDEEMLERARSGARWAARQQLASGGMPRWTSNSEHGPEQADVLAQTIRMALLLEVEELDREGAIARLRTSLRSDGPHGAALAYDDAAGSQHLNSWSTMFGGQALSLAVPGTPRLEWHHLV